MCFLLCCWGVATMSQTYESTVISLEDGLSQSTVFAIAQDHKGFLWLGTEDGLNRYDGREFKVFKHEPFDATSLAGNQVSSIHVDQKGRLWIGLQMEGLSLYQPQSGSFLNFAHDPENPNSLSHSHITCIAEDLSGNIWIGTANGVNRVIIDPKSDEISFQRFHTDPIEQPERSTHYVRCIYEDTQGNLWVSTLMGLGRLNRLEGRLQLIPVIPEQMQTPAFWGHKRGVGAMLQDRLGGLWFGTGVGLFRWEPGTKNWQTYLENDLCALGDAVVSDLKMDLDGNIWAATIGLGLLKIPFNPQTNAYDLSWIHFLDKPTSSGQPPLSNNWLRSLHIDRLNPHILWVGHTTGGLEKFTPVTAPFETDHLDAPALTSLRTRYVSSLLKDQEGTTWIGTNHGLIRYDSSYHLFQHQHGDPFSLSDNAVSTLVEDHSGSIWVGTNRGFQKIAKGQNGQVLFENCWFSKRCNGSHVWAAHEDAEGYFYLALGDGITIYDPETQEFWACSHTPDISKSQGIDYRIFDIFRDQKGHLWIGTSHGLILYRNLQNPARELKDFQPEIYYHNPDDVTSLRNHTILCITEDHEGTVWLGTFSGLIKVKDGGDRLHFESFTEKNSGLSNNVVYGILQDPKTHCLWMSTNKGLSKFDPAYKTFDNFDSSDGLQSNEFNGNAFFQAADGEMLFGGIAGYSRFYPEKIQIDGVPPQVWITSLTTSDNEERNLLHDESKTIELNYAENSFSLDFIALNYTQPQRNAYAYMLEGRDDHWINCKGSRKVNFSRLAPGDYVFRVIAANGDGIWNETGDALQIVINPPFWQRAWFYLLLAGLMILSFTLIHQYRVRAKVRRVMELERVRKNAAADFHDELGHKLTVISLFGEIVKKKLNGRDDILPQLNKIIENANSLYYSMKDLLWVLDPNKDSVYDLALLLKDFGDELFDKTGVAFRTQGIDTRMRGQALPMDYKRHIVLIFKEVMNNALKHSSCENAVLNAYFDAHELTISFRDDGVGFDLASKQKGNGLVNLQTRAGKIEADLSIDSNDNGTLVTLTCEV